MRATQAHRRELVQTLEAMVGAQAAEDGPSSYLFEGVLEANRFLWMEWWARAVDADAALSDDRIRTILTAIRVLGTLECVDRIDRFDRVQQRPVRDDVREDRAAGRHENARTPST